MNIGLDPAVYLTLAAALSPFLTALVKRFLGNPEGNAALGVFVAVSVGISVLTLMATGDFNNLSLANPQVVASEIIVMSLKIIGIGTVVFNLFHGAVTQLEGPVKQAAK